MTFSGCPPSGPSQGHDRGEVLLVWPMRDAGAFHVPPPLVVLKGVPGWGLMETAAGVRGNVRTWPSGSSSLPMGTC
jgi:hypothetical protein